MNVADDIRVRVHVVLKDELGGKVFWHLRVDTRKVL
jgi:hypothetical protein